MYRCVIIMIYDLYVSYVKNCATSTQYKATIIILQKKLVNKIQPQFLDDSTTLWHSQARFMVSRHKYKFQIN